MQSEITKGKHWFVKSRVHNVKLGLGTVLSIRKNWDGTRAEYKVKQDCDGFIRKVKSNNRHGWHLLNAVNNLCCCKTCLAGRTEDSNNNQAQLPGIDWVEITVQ